MRKWPCLSVWRALGAAVAVAVLGACAAPEWQKPGTPQQALLHSLGAPHERVDLPEGGQRWVYSRQPMGQQVFHLLIDPQGHLRSVEQVLTPAHFYALRIGKDTARDVQQYFGRPALIEGVASFRGDIWTYRISDNTIDRLAHVFIDPQGTVQRMMFTDEIRIEREPQR